MDSENLNETEIMKIKNELEDSIEKLIKGCEDLDMKLAFEIFILP
jgi:hypothetical protein